MPFTEIDVMTGNEMRVCKKCGARLSPFMGKKNWEGRICQNCDSMQEVLDANPHLCATDFM